MFTNGNQDFTLGVKIAISVIATLIMVALFVALLLSFHYAAIP